jgi:hypothetical protein
MGANESGSYDKTFRENQSCIFNYDYQAILQLFYLPHGIPKAVVHVPDEIAAHLALSGIVVDFAALQDNAFWDKDLI